MGKKCELHKNMGHVCDLHKKETGYEKGINTQSKINSTPGVSAIGQTVRHAKDSGGFEAGQRKGRIQTKKYQNLKEMKNIKPNLGKSEDHVIGQTSSGKAIHNTHNSPNHKDFTGADHYDAMIIHRNKANDIMDNKTTPFDAKAYKHHGDQFHGHQNAQVGKSGLAKSEKVCALHKKEAHKKHMHELHKHLVKSEVEDGNHKEGAHDSTATEDDDCPYCADQEDNRTDDCQYCQDLDAQENADGTAGMDDCPQCQEYDAEQQETGGIDTDDCPYCDDESLEQANPDMNGDQGLAAEDTGVDHPDDCPECQKMYGEAVENEPGQTGEGDPNLQGHETAEEVLDMLDQEPGAEGQTPADAAQKIDNTEMPQGDAMEDGTAVTENFGDAQKNDVSDADQQFQEETDPNEDEPDMAGVLQSGLDEHADEQKKQQVLDMVGQTLAGFKANKQSLEATKEQNQPLYNSCIQMLKSMIELCKLLGLEPQMPAQAPMEAAPMSQDGQSTPPAAPSEGAAQDPKTLGE